MAETPKYYRSLDEISIYVFHKIMETQDYSLLLIAGEHDDKIANEVWENLYTEYCKLSGDNSSLMYFAVYSELLYLETRFAIASKVLKQLIDCIDLPEVVEIYIDTLREWNYKINRKKPLKSEIERMLKQLKLSQNKIRLKKDELETYKPDDDSEPMTLTQQAVKLAQGLGKDKINTKTTMVDEWIFLIKELKEINEAKKKANNKHR